MLRIFALVDGEADECVQELAWRRLAPLASRAAVRALLNRCSEDLAARLEASGVACAHVALPATPDWSALRDTAAAARAHHAQVLYANGASAHALCALAGPLVRLPVVAHLTRPLGMADAHAHATCRSVLIVASEQARAHALASGCAEAAVVPTPADAPTHPRASRTIGWAGARRAADGLDLFLEAAASMAAVRDDARFRIAAPAAIAEDVRAAAAGLPASVVDLRFGEDGFARDLHVLAHTAWEDATHLTLVDALQAGARVVATTAGGSADLLRYRRALTLYAPGDAEALLRALLIAYDRPHAHVPPEAIPLPGADECAVHALRILAAAAAGTTALAA